MRKVHQVNPDEIGEHIIEWSYHDAGAVRVGVAQGYMVNGVFQPFPGIQIQHYQIMFEDFDKLMAATDNKPQGVFRRDDLWHFIDLCRQGKDACTLRQKTQEMVGNNNQL